MSAKVRERVAAHAWRAAVGALLLVALHAAGGAAQEIFPPPPPGPLAPQIPRDTLRVRDRDDHATLIVYGLRASGSRPEAQQIAPAAQAALRREARLDVAMAPADGVHHGGVRQLGTLGDAALLPAGGVSAGWPRDLYAIDMPDVDARIVFLDTRGLSAAAPTGNQIARAAALLAKTDSAFVAARRFRFLVIEQPLFGSGTSTPAWSDADTASFAGRNRLALLATCERRKVNAVFAGSDRLYQRLWVNTGNGGFWHVTTGGAGRSLDTFKPGARDAALSRALPEGFSVPAGHARTERIMHYCRLELPRRTGAPFTSARFDIYRVVNKSRADLFEHLDLEHGP